MAEEFPMDIELLADSPEMGQTDFSPDPYELGLVSGDKATEGTEDRTACTCATCGKVFNSCWYLKQHAVKHSSERPFRCKHCQKTYRFRSNLYQHKCPTREKFPPAQSNGHQTPSTSQSKAVRAKMVGRFPHPTNVFVDPEGLSIRPSALPSDKDSAGVSDRRPNTVSQAEVDRFLERHRDKLHKCHKCKIYFPTREYLQQHTAWHNNDAKVKCLHCSESFDDELSYASHKTSHTPQSPHVCPHCRGKFAHRLALKKHLVRCTNAPHHYTNNWGKVMDRSPARPQTSPSAPFYRDSPDGTENPSSVGSAPSLGSTNGSRSSGQDQNNSVASQFAAEPASDGIGTFQISVSSIDGPSDWVGENSVLLNSSPLPFLRSGEGEVEVRVMSRQHEVSQCSLKLAHIKTAIGVIRPAPLHLLNRFPNGRSKSRMGGMQFLQVKLVRPSLPTKKFQSGGEKSVLKKESIPSRQSSKDSRRCDQGTLPARRFVCANCGGSFPSKLGLVRHLQRRNCTK